MRLIASKTFSSPHRAAADGERRRRLGKLDRFERHRLLGLGVSKVAVSRSLATGVPGDGLVYGLALLADEVRDASKPLRRTGARVGERLVRAATTTHDPEDAQAACVRVHVVS